MQSLGGGHLAAVAGTGRAGLFVAGHSLLPERMESTIFGFSVS